MSMIITAKDNDKIKYTKSLLKSKNRNKALILFLVVAISVIVILFKLFFSY